MTSCKYWDCGWCYAPDEVLTTAQPSGACAAPSFCPYLVSQMTEIDISKVLIEGDTATIMGVKYQRVEEPMSRFTENPDEIVLEDVKMFHLESMNERALWIGVYGKDGKIYHLNISADDDKLRYYWSDETVE